MSHKPLDTLIGEFSSLVASGTTPDDALVWLSILLRDIKAQNRQDLYADLKPETLRLAFENYARVFRRDGKVAGITCEALMDQIIDTGNATLTGALDPSWTAAMKAKRERDNNTDWLKYRAT